MFLLKLLKYIYISMNQFKIPHKTHNLIDDQKQVETEWDGYHLIDHWWGLQIFKAYHRNFKWFYHFVFGSSSYYDNVCVEEKKDKVVGHLHISKSESDQHVTWHIHFRTISIFLKISSYS